MIVRIRTLKAASGQLAGATLGQEHLREVSKRLERGLHQAVILDFAGVKSATGSYLKSLLLPLVREQPEETRTLEITDVYVLFAGLSEEVREELRLVLKAENTATLEALEWTPTDLAKAQVLGDLDPTLAETLAALVSMGVGTATSLAVTKPNVKITVTAWNNRLAELHRLRLVHRIKQGRELHYTPVAEHMDHG